MKIHRWNLLREHKWLRTLLAATVELPRLLHQSHTSHRLIPANARVLQGYKGRSSPVTYKIPPPGAFNLKTSTAWPNLSWNHAVGQDSSFPILLPSLSLYTDIRPVYWSKGSLCLLLIPPCDDLKYIHKFIDTPFKRKRQFSSSWEWTRLNDLLLTNRMREVMVSSFQYYVITFRHRGSLIIHFWFTCSGRSHVMRVLK